MNHLMIRCCYSQEPHSLVLGQEGWGKMTVNTTPKSPWFYPNHAGVTWALAGLLGSSQAEPGILLSPGCLWSVVKLRTHSCLPPSLCCYITHGPTLHLDSGIMQKPDQRVALGLSPLNLMTAAKSQAWSTSFPQTPAYSNLNPRNKMCKSDWAHT